MVKEDLIKEIQKKRANIAVIGMGYVGLPLAITFANAGFNVTSIDSIQEKVDMINRGEVIFLMSPTLNEAYRQRQDQSNQRLFRFG